MKDALQVSEPPPVCRRCFSHGAVLLGLVLVLLASAPVRAPVLAAGLRPGAPLSNMYGAVLSATLPSGADQRGQFVIQPARHAPVTVELLRRAVIVPRTAEAAVSGFTQGDFAYARVRRIPHRVVAVYVLYDAAPFHPYPTVVLKGDVVRVSANGSVLVLRVWRSGDSGPVTRRVSLSDGTSYLVDGQPTDSPPALVAGEPVTIYAERHGLRLVATVVMLSSAADQ